MPPISAAASPGVERGHDGVSGRIHGAARLCSRGGRLGYVGGQVHACPEAPLWGGGYPRAVRFKHPGLTWVWSGSDAAILTSEPGTQTPAEAYSRYFIVPQHRSSRQTSCESTLTGHLENCFPKKLGGRFRNGRSPLCPPTLVSGPRCISSQTR